MTREFPMTAPVAHLRVLGKLLRRTHRFSRRKTLGDA